MVPQLYAGAVTGIFSCLQELSLLPKKPTGAVTGTPAACRSCNWSFQLPA